MPESSAFFLQLAHHVLERVHAAGDAHQVERRGLALDGVQLAEQAVELLAELLVGARRLLQDGVDQLQAGLGRVQERDQLQRIDVHHAEHHVELRVGVLLRLLQLARQQHAGGDVAHRAQHVLDALRAHHAVEVELQVAGLLAAVAVVHRDFELPSGLMLFIRFSWARSPHSSLMYFMAVARVADGTRSLSSSSKVEAGEVLAAEHARQRLRPHRADAVVGVEQEEALAHRLEDVAGLLLGFARGALVARAGQLEVGGGGGQHQRREHAGRAAGCAGARRRRRSSAAASWPAPPAAPAAPWRCRWRTAARA